MLNLIKCPLCNSGSNELIKEYSYKNDIFSNCKIVKCNSCELYFANPTPKESELNNYNNSYHQSAHGGIITDAKTKGFFYGLSKLRLNMIKDNINILNESKINVLEVGPGPGYFASLWLSEFPDSKYFAIESDKSCYKPLKDLNIEIIESKNLINLKFDLIVISHVLEHVCSPVEFLNQYVKCLKSKGNLFIEVPCNDWKHKKICEPHLLFFSKKPMEKLSKVLGLEILSMNYYGTSIKKTKNLLFKFINRLRVFFYYKFDIKLYHRKRKKINELLNDGYATEALLNFDAHLIKKNESLWLRSIFKK